MRRRQQRRLRGARNLQVFREARSLAPEPLQGFEEVEITDFEIVEKPECRLVMTLLVDIPVLVCFENGKYQHRQPGSIFAS